MKAIIAALAAGCICGGVLAAFAAEQTVTQKGKAFSQTAMTIKKGDTLVFQNDDDVVHNVMSSVPGSEFNLGAQQPGSKVSQAFSKSGEISVICAIHPRMKLTLTVVD
ncbi:MAG TPA: plastocyanin/azurin family copper-binding protein [Xanthobacteraceae bacterium]